MLVDVPFLKATFSIGKRYIRKLTLIVSSLILYAPLRSFVLVTESGAPAAATRVAI